MELPEFRYHPDPLASGSVVESKQACRCCGMVRGYVYTGPVYAEEDLQDALCPWCIADGSAHSKFGGTFVDSEAFTGVADNAVMTALVERTPGFSAWQSEQWPCCCADATAFVTPAGIQELRQHKELEGLALSHIIYDIGFSGGAAKRLLESLDRNAGPTAYVFQCLHCRRYLFHIDFA
jgi:uncharacterized protein CbrC (UPF0167 family)